MSRAAKRVCLVLAALLALQPALVYADNVGIIQGVITQNFQAPVQPSGMTDGQVLKYQASTGTWVNGSAAAGPTTSTLAQVLANGNSADRQINWSTGAGVIAHLLGPSDQSFTITALGAGNDLVLASSRDVLVYPGSGKGLAVQFPNGTDVFRVTSIGATTITSSADVPLSVSTTSSTSGGRVAAFACPVTLTTGAKWQVLVQDTTALAAGNGGGIVLTADVRAGPAINAPIVSIYASKTNATDNDRNGYLVVAPNNNVGGSVNNCVATLGVSDLVVKVNSGVALGWTSSATNVTTTANDLGLSRISPGILGIGTGAAASVAGSLNVANVTMTAASNGQLTWTTGGLTYSAGPSSQIYGNTDFDFFISAGTPATGHSGHAITLTASNGVGNSQNGGLISLSAGRSTTGSGTAGNSGAFLTLNPATTTGGGQASLSGGNGDNATNNSPSGGFIASTGVGSGNASSDFVVQSGFSLGSGSTQQQAYDRQRITSKTFACSTSTGTNNVYLVLSNAVSNSGVGCSVDYVLEVGDGANHWSTITGVQTVAAENRNGTVVATCTTAGTSNQAISSTTTFTSLACTTTVAISGTNIQIRLTPSWAAGTPTVVRVTYQARCSGQGSLTPQ